MHIALRRSLAFLLTYTFVCIQSAFGQSLPERQATLIPRPEPALQQTNMTDIPVLSNATTDEVAEALGLNPSNVTVDFGESDPDAFQVLSTPAASFPTEGSSYLVLSSGFSSSALEPNDEGDLSGNLEGLTTPGSAGGNDLTQMTLTIDVPDETEAITFDFKFLSEEFPEFVGTQFNDGFLVEVDSSTFTIEDTNGDFIPDIVAPANVVVDDDGELLSINTTGALSFEAGNASGTTYDGASPVLSTSIPIPEGASSITLVFSIFDAGDDIYDSAVFINDITVGGGGGTGIADNTPPECTGSLDGTTFSGTASDSQEEDEDNTGIFSIELSGNSENLVLNPDDFEEGAEEVAFEVTLDDPTMEGSGMIIATDGDGNQCTTPVEIPGGSEPPPTDDTPPVCGPINVERTAEGDLAAISTSASDPESGIASVVFTTLQNLEGFLQGAGGYAEGDAETFDPEATATVEIRGERLDFVQGGAIMTRVTNGAGDASMCDPVVEQIAAGVPQRFSLEGSYPNPFRETTRIAFSLAEAAPVRLEVFDLLGRKVATLIRGEQMAASAYEVEWDGRDESGQAVESGVYFYHIEAGNFVATRRMTLVR